LKKAPVDNRNFPEASLVQTLRNPWMVQFDTTMRGPLKPVVFNTLTDWSLNSDDRIKSYSGTAIYSTSFTMDDLHAVETIYINLGTVKAMAKVKVNGVDLGTVWTAPWQVDATTALKKGKNKLEIEVVNTWVNRLISDSKSPEAVRKTWTSTGTYSADSKYEAAGLMGPVRILSVKY
jgi:hypothetical protein